MRKLFVLAAQLGPGAKTQSILLEPFACCRGIPRAGEVPGEHHGPPCQMPHSRKARSWRLLSEQDVHHNECTLRHHFSGVHGTCQSWVSGLPL